MNVRLLRKIQKYILAEPRRLLMHSWGRTLSQSVIENNNTLPPCGTQACIAGTCAILTGAVTLPKTSAILSYVSFPDTTEHRARRSLGLTKDESKRLFYFKEWNDLGWPRRFSTAYDLAKTPRGRANAAVRRIDHFIKTKGAE